MATARTVNCPQCGRPVEWTNQWPYRPFCSKRCKLIDLGAWAAEAYRVPAEPPDRSELADAFEERDASKER